MSVHRLGCDCEPTGGPLEYASVVWNSIVITIIVAREKTTDLLFDIPQTSIF